MGISVAISNLGKYTEGIIDFTWLELPATDAEWQHALDTIGMGQPDPFGVPYEEWFVSDYDSEFPIYETMGSYPSIRILNLAGEIAEDIEGAKDFQDLVTVCDEHGLDAETYDLGSYFDNEDPIIEEMVRAELDKGGWRRVMHFLAKCVTSMETDAVKVDAYGNLIPICESERKQRLNDAKFEIFGDILENAHAE